MATLYKCVECKKTIFNDWERIYSTTRRFLRKEKLNWSMHKECYKKYEERLIKDEKKTEETI